MLIRFRCAQLALALTSLVAFTAPAQAQINTSAPADLRSGDWAYDALTALAAEGFCKNDSASEGFAETLSLIDATQIAAACLAQQIEDEKGSGDLDERQAMLGLLENIGGSGAAPYCGAGADLAAADASSPFVVVDFLASGRLCVYSSDAQDYQVMIWNVVPEYIRLILRGPNGFGSADLTSGYEIKAGVRPPFPPGFPTIDDSYFQPRSRVAVGTNARTLFANARRAESDPFLADEPISGSDDPDAPLTIAGLDWSFGVFSESSSARAAKDLASQVRDGQPVDLLDARQLDQSSPYQVTLISPRGWLRSLSQTASRSGVTNAGNGITAGAPAILVDLNLIEKEKGMTTDDGQTNDGIAGTELFERVCQTDGATEARCQSIRTKLLSNYGAESLAYIGLAGWDRWDEARTLGNRMGSGWVADMTRYYSDLLAEPY